MPGRTCIFIDFWNFQINWNKRVNERCDWKRLPRVLVDDASQVLQEVGDNTFISRLSLVETRLYASVDPHNENERRLKGWA